AGFSIKKKLFFRNFLTVVLFGVGGTLVTAAVLAAGSYRLLEAGEAGGERGSSLALGAVLSCTDSVAALQLLHRDRERVPVLYSLLFGEGVVNDATAIVLLGTIMNLPYTSYNSDNTLSPRAVGVLVLRFVRLFALSTALGLGVGVVSAAIVRPDQEVLTVALLGLVAYFLAEGLQLSAVLSVFFCGIAMSHYTWHNL
ncbi:hypothetical protein VOLCADRAFT_34043, partial [Volvox carteri f. nagariensis]